MEQLSRRLLPGTLLMLSMNAIIGSGWLLAPLYAARIAGPAAIFSWIIGGFAVVLIAFTFAEISAMFPVAGGTARIPQLSHGALVGFVLSWMAWLSSLMMAPVEVQAVLQYASLFFPSLIHTVGVAHLLTLWGYIWATILMLILCTLNIISFRALTHSNFILFVFKVSVVILTAIVIMNARFNSQNFSGMIETTLSLEGWQTILAAIATSGIAFAFNGFKNSVELAGEAKKLAIAIPLSTAGSVIACLFIYIALQVCFIGALDSASLRGGWQHLNFAGDVGPFAGLAAAIGLVWLVKVLYFSAVISPAGAGLTYVTATARILYAMSKIGYVPKFLSRLSRHHLPVRAIMANFIIGMLSFLPLPGWQAMVNFLVSVLVITYAMGPISLMSLRLSMPDIKRPFRLPAANLLCFLAFYFCNLFSYWTGWETMSKLAIALFIGFIFFGISYFRGTIKVDSKSLESGFWMLPYLLGLVIISYLGSFGGLNIIPFGWDFLVIALFTFGILYLAIRGRLALSSTEMNHYIGTEMVNTIV